MTREDQRGDKQDHGEFQKHGHKAHESGSREYTGGTRMWLGYSTSYRTVRANLSFPHYALVAHLLLNRLICYRWDCRFSLWWLG